MAPDRGPERTDGSRVGVFGGTFDPPHLGHLVVAQDVAEALGLDLVVWIPAGAPPHKTEVPLSAPGDRLAMVRAATRDDDRFRVNELELERDGPSYTVDTLRSLQGTMGRAELTLIVGADQYGAFDTWRDPDEIRSIARIAVMDRAGAASGERTDEAATDAQWVAVTRIDISSTLVRERVGAGRSVRYLVPDGVRRIIEGKRLYRERV